MAHMSLQPIKLLQPFLHSLWVWSTHRQTDRHRDYVHDLYNRLPISTVRFYGGLIIPIIVEPCSYVFSLNPLMYAIWYRLTFHSGWSELIRRSTQDSILHALLLLCRTCLVATARWHCQQFIPSVRSLMPICRKRCLIYSSHHQPSLSSCLWWLTDYSCIYYYFLPSVLLCCWLGSRKGIRLVKNWVVGCW